MVHDPGLAVRPRCLAVHTGFSGQNGSKDRLEWLASRRVTVGRPPIGAAADLADWIDRFIPFPNFKVQLRAPDIARITNLCNDLSSLNLLTSPHEKCLIMGVCRHPAMGVLNK